MFAPVAPGRPGQGAEGAGERLFGGDDREAGDVFRPRLQRLRRLERLARPVVGDVVEDLDPILPGGLKHPAQSAVGEVTGFKHRLEGVPGGGPVGGSHLDHRSAVIGVGQLRIDADGLVELRDRLVGELFLKEQATEAVVRGGIVRGDLAGAADQLECGVPLAVLPGVVVAENDQRPGIARVGLEHVEQGVDGVVGLAGLQQHHGQLAAGVLA